MNKTPPAWLENPPREKPGPGRVLITTDRYPVYYLQITKCGCTFLRNLMYLLDHDAAHPDSARIHSYNDEFVKATMVPLWIMRKSPYVFTVVRNPVDRFFSLYFDKIADGTNAFDKGIRERVMESAGLDIVPANDLAGHQENCLKTLHWLKKNIAGETGVKVNAHWQRQSNRIEKVEGLPVKFLTLDGLAWQLPALLEPIIPNIRETMAEVKSRNVSPKLFSKEELATPEIEAAVLDIYAKDGQVYSDAARAWENHAPAKGA